MRSIPDLEYSFPDRKAAEVALPGNAAAEPEQLQVRVQLKKKNVNYGQPSDIVYVTVNR